MVARSVVTFTGAGMIPLRRGGATAVSFGHAFRRVFESDFERVRRILHRLSGDPDLACDLAQDAFVRLYERGSLPESPASWVITVGLNLLRNAQSSDVRRRRLLTIARGERSHSDPPPAPDDEVTRAELRARVRTALDALPERDRALLLLRAEGFSYKEMAVALDLHEASVGTLLLRAGRRLRGGLHDDDAP